MGKISVDPAESIADTLQEASQTVLTRSCKLSWKKMKSCGHNGLWQQGEIEGVRLTVKTQISSVHYGAACGVQVEAVVRLWELGKKRFQRMTQLGCGHANKWFSWSGAEGHWSSEVWRLVRLQCESNDRERERMRLWTRWWFQWENFHESSPCQKEKVSYLISSLAT